MTQKNIAKVCLLRGLVAQITPVCPMNSAGRVSDVFMSFCVRAQSSVIQVSVASLHKALQTSMS